MTAPETEPEMTLVSDHDRTKALHDALSQSLEKHLKKHNLDGADALMGVLNFARTSLVWLSIHADLHGSQRTTFFRIALQYLAQALAKEDKRLSEGVDGPRN